MNTGICGRLFVAASLAGMCLFGVAGCNKAADDGATVEAEVEAADGDTEVIVETVDEN